MTDRGNGISDNSLKLSPFERVLATTFAAIVATIVGYWALADLRRSESMDARNQKIVDLIPVLVERIDTLSRAFSSMQKKVEKGELPLAQIRLTTLERRADAQERQAAAIEKHVRVLERILADHDRTRLHPAERSGP